MKQTQQPRLFRVRRAGLFLLAFALAMPGCASIANFAAMRGIPVAGPQNPVIDFSCIWQQGEGRDQHGKPCRGFCGQLMFLTAASKKPGVIRGAVSIYVFDNVGTLAEQTKPFQTFEFSADEWASFQRRTNLGMTYQLFVPYTRPGGREAECQLHVKFTPEGAETPIYSHPESVSLGGASGAASMANAIDRKLTSSSMLFQNPSVMTPAAKTAAYSELLRELQTNAQAQPASSATPATPVPAKNHSGIERLQAVLDQSTPRTVQQADHEDTTLRRSRVTQALHEDSQE